MNTHDAINKQAKACRLIVTAKEFCTPAGVDYLNMVDSLVREVGDKYFGKAFQDELNRVHEDA